jgi:hypothetical protein
MESTRTISFFIHLSALEEAVSSSIVPPLSLDNGQTNERLVFQGAEDVVSLGRIARYPIGASEEWIEQKMISKYWTDEYGNLEINIKS